MVLAEICAPAFIYLCFSLVQITIDTVKSEYNKAFFKFWVMIIFTMLLNNLCMRGLGIVSWIIVFVPFMLMSVITTILLYVFGFDPSTGKLRYYTEDSEESQEKSDKAHQTYSQPAANIQSSQPSEIRKTDKKSNNVENTQSKKENDSEFNPEPTETNDNIVTQTSKRDTSSDLKKTLHIDNELVNTVVEDYKK